MPTLPLHAAVVHLPLGLAFALPLVAIGLALAYGLRRVTRQVLGILVGLQLLVVASGWNAARTGEAGGAIVYAHGGAAAFAPTPAALRPVPAAGTSAGKAGGDH